MIEQYKLIKQVGSGAHSTVWKCQHRDGGPLLACKVMSKGFTKFKRYRNEVDCLRWLMGRPHILEYEGHFEDRYNYYLLTEYCDGGALKEDVRYTEQFTRKVMREALMGLREVHGASIIHRDIKMSNLFLRNGVVKIGDFGAAILDVEDGEVRDGHEIVGTPVYMAPEVFSKIYSTQSDVWALGVIAYYMITGGIPFEFKTFGEVRESILNHEVGMEDLKLSYVGKVFINKCLEKEYRERWSVHAALMDLWVDPRYIKENKKNKL